MNNVTARFKTLSTEHGQKYVDTHIWLFNRSLLPPVSWFSIMAPCQWSALLPVDAGRRVEVGAVQTCQVVPHQTVKTLSGFEHRRRRIVMLERDRKTNCCHTVGVLPQGLNMTAVWTKVCLWVHILSIHTSCHLSLLFHLIWPLFSLPRQLYWSA